MNFVYAILRVLGVIIILIITLYIIKILIDTIIQAKKSEFWKKKKGKKLPHLIFTLRKHRYNNYFELFKWVMIDILRGKTKYKLFGIWCFTGYYGQGKTLGAVSYAFAVKEKMAKVGINIHIVTNFHCRGQDFMITKWQDLLTLPKYTIVIFDEIQSTFTSQKFKEFPIELLWKITQCRKQKLCVFASSPVYSRMAIQIRESTDFVIVCSNRLDVDRYFTYDFYRANEYEKYCESELKLFTKRKWRHTLIAQDYDYRRYNTEEIVDRFDIKAE